MKIYDREKEFVIAFFAALSLNGCKKVKINNELLNKIMPVLKNKVNDENMFNKKEDIDTLYLLFMKDVYGYYSTLLSLIEHINPLVFKIDNDCLGIDPEVAKKYLNDGMFPAEKMIDIAGQLMPVIEKNEKVKVYENHKKLA